MLGTDDATELMRFVRKGLLDFQEQFGIQLTAEDVLEALEGYSELIHESLGSVPFFAQLDNADPIDE